jgi:hypothetical protein
MPTSTLPDVNESSEGASGSKRVNVVFSNDQFEKLQQLATSQGITLSDALRQAIGVSSLVVNANADPDTQILLKKGDSVQELKLVR